MHHQNVNLQLLDVLNSYYQDLPSIRFIQSPGIHQLKSSKIWKYFNQISSVGFNQIPTLDLTKMFCKICMCFNQTLESTTFLSYVPAVNHIPHLIYIDQQICEEPLHFHIVKELRVPEQSSSPT